jgi:medium-chain acyl-[acyl-carrier-protein] hydrolase
VTAWYDRGNDAREDLPLLVTFPFAGGGAGFYRPWRRDLVGACELWAALLPGRETRIREQPRTELEPLIGELVDALGPLERTYVLAGHSLGATLALTVALGMRARGYPLPARLVLSGSPAPHLRDIDDPAHILDAAALVERLKTYEGTPRALLESRELLDLLLPTIRADFALVETWVVPDAAPLAVPLTVLGGSDDGSVARHEIEGWRMWTTRSCDVHWFSGGHFFVSSAHDRVVAVVRDALSQLNAAAIA